MSRSDRTVALILGVGLLAWAGGDIAWTLETQNGGLPPVPSAADGFYLAFYPLAYVALMLLMRSQVSGMQLSRWLDGIVAGSARRPSARPSLLTPSSATRTDRLLSSSPISLIPSLTSCSWPWQSAEWR